MVKPWLFKAVGASILGIVLLTGCAMPETVKAISTETPAATSAPTGTVSGSGGLHWCDVAVRCSITEPLQLEHLYRTVESRLNEFRVFTYAAMPSVELLYVDDGYVSSCGSDIYYHCRDDNTVVIHKQPAWQDYQSYSTSPLVILAHEWAHNVQRWSTDAGHGKSMYGPRVSDSEWNFIREQQADCAAGAFFGWLQGYENPQTFDEDLGDARVFMTTLASPNTSNRTHGNPQERVNSFDSGLYGGLSACNWASNRSGEKVRGVLMYGNPEPN